MKENDVDKIQFMDTYKTLLSSTMHQRLAVAT